jgi:thiaminase/transcriptional activator TenA
MSFSRHLLDRAELYMQAQVKKRFLQGLIHGDLPRESFQYWLRVDYPYLHNFQRVCALRLLKADDPNDAEIFLGHIQGIQDEMRDHEKHAANMGVSQEALRSTPMGPLKYSYTRHQLASAYDGSLGEVQAALLACQWGYGEAVHRLLQDHTIAEDNPYQEWFAFHGHPDHRENVKKAYALLDRQAEHSTEGQRDRMAEIFMISVRHETMLWDEYYDRVQWETYPKGD